MNKKILGLAVICLLVGMAVAPGINAYVNKSSSANLDLSSNVEMIKIEVNECFGEEMSQRYVLEIPLETATEVMEKLRDVNTPEKQISILKNYGLIRDNITWEYIQKNYKENLRIIERNKVIENLLSNIAKKNDTTRCRFNLNCEVTTIMSAFPILMPIISWPLLPITGIFVLAGFVAGVGRIDTWNGTQGGWWMQGYEGVVVLGFVGLWFNMVVGFLMMGNALFVGACHLIYNQDEK